MHDLKYPLSEGLTDVTRHGTGKKGLKLLDLSFDGLSTKQCSGFRVTTSSRTRTPNASHPRALRSHPQSAYSIKLTEYSIQNQTDFDELITDDRWATPTVHEAHLSGASPLFIAPTKIHNDHKNRHDWMLGHERPLSANDAARYKPNRMHQYLTITELKNASQSEIDLRLGKPTRTTLLRARQRINSASQNAYDIHRDQVKQAEKIAETRRQLTQAYSLQDLLAIPLEEETLHSFLIGARYNRANYVDNKIILTQGVYMPRSNPGACFIIPRTHRNTDNQDYPTTPPDSPFDCDHLHQSIHDAEDRRSFPFAPRIRPVSPAPESTPRPTSPTNFPPPQRPPSPHSAWVEEATDVDSDHDQSLSEDSGSRQFNQKDLNTSRVPLKEFREDNIQTTVRKTESRTLDLNIKGKALDNMKFGFGRARSASGRHSAHFQDDVQAPVPSSAVPETIMETHANKYNKEMTFAPDSHNKTAAESELILKVTNTAVKAPTTHFLENTDDQTESNGNYNPTNIVKTEPRINSNRLHEKRSMVNGNENSTVMNGNGTAVNGNGTVLNGNGTIVNGNKLTMNGHVQISNVHAQPSGLPTLLVSRKSVNPKVPPQHEITDSLQLKSSVVTPAPRQYSPRVTKMETKKERKGSNVVRKPGKEMADKTFNVPSIHGNYEETMEAGAVELESAVLDDSIVMGLGMLRENKQNGRLKSAKSYKSRVTFEDTADKASLTSEEPVDSLDNIQQNDEINLNPSKENAPKMATVATEMDSNNVVFFMTEENESIPVPPKVVERSDNGGTYDKNKDSTIDIPQELLDTHNDQNSLEFHNQDNENLEDEEVNDSQTAAEGEIDPVPVLISVDISSKGKS